jgi:preprotein translocase subunit YajC
VAGLAVTVDAVADTAPAVNVTEAVWVSVMVSVASVAVSVLVPAVVDLTVPVVCPLTSVAAAGWATVSAAPREDANVTVFPLTGLPFPSRSVTVMVEVATPSAVTVAGLAVTVDAVADTVPTVNVTAAVWVIVTVSVVSVAVSVLVPALVERTVPVVCPFASVTAAGWVTVSAAPRDEDRATVLPLTGLPLPSRNVTVIVDVATPSAVTVVGLAVTVEVVADTAPAVNVTEAVWVTVMRSVVSVAVIVAVPAVVERTVPVAWPFASVAALG